MERTCHRCDQPTWVMWEGSPWCRGHFIDEQDARQEADGGVTPATGAALGR